MLLQDLVGPWDAPTKAEDSGIQPRPFGCRFGLQFRLRLGPFLSVKLRVINSERLGRVFANFDFG